MFVFSNSGDTLDTLDKSVCLTVSIIGLVEFLIQAIGTEGRNQSSARKTGLTKVRIVVLDIIKHRHPNTRHIGGFIHILRNCPSEAKTVLELLHPKFFMECREWEKQNKYGYAMDLHEFDNLQLLVKKPAIVKIKNLKEMPEMNGLMCQLVEVQSDGWKVRLRNSLHKDASGKIVPFPYLAGMEEFGRDAPFLGECINIPAKNLFVPYYNIPPDFTESSYFLMESYSFYRLAQKILSEIVSFKAMTNEDFDKFLKDHTAAIQKECILAEVDNNTWRGPQAGSGEASSAQNANLKFILKYDKMIKDDKTADPVRPVEKMTPKHNSSTSSARSVVDQIANDHQIALELAQRLDEMENNATMPITMPTKIPTKIPTKKKKETDMADLDDEKKVLLHKKMTKTMQMEKMTDTNKPKNVTIPPRPFHDPPPPPPRSSTGVVLPKAAPPGFEAPRHEDLVLTSHIRFEKDSFQKTNKLMQCKDAKSYLATMTNRDPPTSAFPDGYLQGGYLDTAQGDWILCWEVPDGQDCFFAINLGHEPPRVGGW